MPSAADTSPSGPRPGTEAQLTSAPASWSKTASPPRTSSQSSGLHTCRPAQTVPQQLSSISASAISGSSVASGSQQPSPNASPENQMATTNTSMQASPEPERGRDAEPGALPPFQLGDPLLYRTTSATSVKSGAGPSSASVADELGRSKDIGLVRRLSSKARGFVRSRRQSSTTPASRDNSIGPAILRRRSDSNNTAPPDAAVFMSDSDEDFSPAEKDELSSLLDGPAQVTPISNAASTSGSVTPADGSAGPVIPTALIKGTPVFKISKKRKYKKICLVLDSEAAKVTWDKSRPSKCIYIDDIKEIRIGSDTRQYRLDFDVPESEEGRFFSILYVVTDRTKAKVMHLIAEDEQTFNHWVTTLDAISRHRHDLMTSLMSFSEKAIRAYWTGEMTKQFGGRAHSADEEEIDLPGVERVCRNLHIHVTSKELQRKFAMADATGTKRLNFAEFRVFVQKMKQRADICALYHEIAAEPDRGISWTEFAAFLRDSQGEDVEAEQQRRSWEARFMAFSKKNKAKEADSVTKGEARLCEDQLAEYLTSIYNQPLSREPGEYSLDRPLNEYFISSSHNTYLLGRQVADQSSIEGYITSLVKGCRSIEIDCWDGDGGQPQVQHGYAINNAISFREVINVVNKYAFSASRFPLWISLEVHCNGQQQIQMANIMKEVFGPRLVTEPLDPSSDKLPTPTELRERILVKVKAASMPEEARKAKPGGSTTGRRRGNSLTSPYAKPVALDNSTIPAQFLSQSPKLGPREPGRRMGTRYNTITEGEVAQAQELASSSTSDNESGGETSSGGKRKQSKIQPELAALGVYCTGVKFGGFQALECKMPYHILSFMEGTFKKNTMSKELKDGLYRHNMRYMMRVYPQYTRINSHNFNPLMYWRKGVQMSALNWQTFDMGMQMNCAMFSGGTDWCGYVLKPHPMREIRMLPGSLRREADVAREEVRKLVRKKMVFSIDVISAQQLMRPANLPANRTVDPYVEVEVFHANDKRDKKDSSFGIAYPNDSPLKYRTQIVRENGFNPMFNQKFKFNITTKYPELVFVRWTVKLSSDGESWNDRLAPVASWMAKLGSLKQGYRTLPLLDASGDRFLFSTLFCRIQVESVTDVYVSNNAPGESVGKFKTLGRTVFSRSSNARPTLERSLEKSFEKLDGSDQQMATTSSARP